MNPNAICGGCGKKFSKHYHEDEDYCFSHTNGDIFTDEPHDTHLVNFIRNWKPEFIEAAIEAWRAKNGHESKS